MHPFDCDCQQCRYADDNDRCRWCDRRNCTILDHVLLEMEDKARPSPMDEVDK